MKTLKPEDDHFINELRTNTQRNPSKLPPEKRAELHRAIESSTSISQPWLRRIVLGTGSAFTLICLGLYFISNQPQPQTTQIPSTSIQAEADYLDWELPEPFQTRIAEAQSDLRSLESSLERPSTFRFKTRTQRLRTRIQKLESDLS
ncbi:MAG: hypothetical protein AAGC73_02110 [Verrucomicrobiota bacterium]